MTHARLVPSPSSSSARLETNTRPRAGCRHDRANVFEEGGQIRAATVARHATVQREGEREIEHDVEYFNLDVIISVGYRVKSHRGTQLRI